MRQERIGAARHEFLADCGAWNILIGSKIVGPVRNDVSHAAAGIGDIARVARDNVQMEVGDGLASCRAFVEADIEPVWMETF
jgi:hypothetical protein